MLRKSLCPSLIALSLLTALACQPNASELSGTSTGALPSFVKQDVKTRDSMVQLFNWPFHKITDEMATTMTQMRFATVVSAAAAAVIPVFRI